MKILYSKAISTWNNARNSFSENSGNFIAHVHLHKSMFLKFFPNSSKQEFCMTQFSEPNMHGPWLLSNNSFINKKNTKNNFLCLRSNMTFLLSRRMHRSLLMLTSSPENLSNVVYTKSFQFHISTSRYRINMSKNWRHSLHSVAMLAFVAVYRFHYFKYLSILIFRENIFSIFVQVK